MTRIGIVGIGFMGMIHYLAAQKLKGAKVTAICSRDTKKLKGDWRGIQGNFGPPGRKMDLSGVSTYTDFEDFLANPNIDLVDICNPTHLHPATVLAALRAGKHVLVEKSIALDAHDADTMLEASRKAGKLLMVAHVLPFFPEFAFAAEAVRSGKYGKVKAAHFMRIIARPNWSTEIGDPGKTGGPAIDLHIHDTHFIGLACGVPDRIFSTGNVENGCVQHLTTQYLYGPGGPAVTCSSGSLAQKGRPFVHGFEIYLEKATLAYESGTKPLTIYAANGTVKQPKLKGGNDPIAAFTAELQAAVRGVKEEKEPALLSGQLARDALLMCHKECQSVLAGKAVAIR